MKVQPFVLDRLLRRLSPAWFSSLHLPSAPSRPHSYQYSLHSFQPSTTAPPLPFPLPSFTQPRPLRHSPGAVDAHRPPRRTTAGDGPRAGSAREPSPCASALGASWPSPTRDLQLHGDDRLHEHRLRPPRQLALLLPQQGVLLQCVLPLISSFRNPLTVDFLPLQTATLASR